MGLILLGSVGGLLFAWGALLAVLWRVRLRTDLCQEAVRVLPDVARLVLRLTLDRHLPSGVRVRLGLLMVYLALPFDIVPDFLPVIGALDDVIVAVWALRASAHRIGRQRLAHHWPGTASGLEAVEHLAGLRQRKTRQTVTA